MKICRSIICLFCLVGFSCQSKPDLSEDRGNEITPAGELDAPQEMVWSKAGDEVFYLSLPPNGQYAVRARNITTKAARLIDGRNRQYAALTLSHDGSKLFYLAHDYQARDLGLFRISTDGLNLERLIGNVKTLFPPVQPSFVLSSDEIHLAYVAEASDSLFVYNLVDKSGTFLAHGSPMTFSPDGKQLLYAESREGSPSSDHFIFSPGTGAKQPISFGLDPQRQHLYLTRWDGDGIRIFYRGEDVRFYFVRDVTTGTVSKVWEQDYGVPISPHFSWSPDGSRISAWTSKCLVSRGFLDCEVTQFSLHVINANGQNARVIAYGNDNGGATAFFSDGKQIAYSFGFKMYVRSITSN